MLVNKRLWLFLILSLLAMPAMAETISIPGTGDGTAVLKAVAAAFSLQHPGVKIELPTSDNRNGGIKGSGGGIKAAGTDRTLLARVAREIKSKEAHYGLSYLPYAKIPATFFVTPDVPVEYLSHHQICDIYSGKLINWAAVGGPDQPITVIRREEGDSTLSVLRKSFPGFDQIKITDKALLIKKTPEVFQVMREKKFAIAFGPYDVAKNSDVQILKIDGRSPTFSGYPSMTTLGLVYKKEKLTPTAKQFLDFAISHEANLAIIVAGGIPLN